MIQLTDTTACKMRDELKRNRSKTLTPKTITSRLTKIGIPEWLRAEVIQMVNYRVYDRCTCVMEQAMFQAVCNLIVVELMNESK